MSSGPVRLVLLRHGQSEWNAAGIFTGWENAHLTAHGELEAARAGALLAGHGVLPAFVHTSLQRRTIRTADLALAAADRDWIPVRRSWRLNGRHYGALQGRNKAEVIREYGERQVWLWRRSYDVTPPPVTLEQLDDPRYAMLPPEARPRAESLRDVTMRLLPYWYDAIVPDLRADGCGLVVSHGNTLRAGPVLVEAAENADLLVMGNRGHGGLAEALLGSVGQNCVHHAPCPVVIMRGKAVTHAQSLAMTAIIEGQDTPHGGSGDTQ